MAIAEQRLADHHEEAELNWPAIKRFGLWLFFLSESILFGLLLAARFFLLGTGGEHLNQSLGLLVTSILLASSVTAYLAEGAARAGQRGLMVWGLSLTILMGVVFAVGVGFEWSIAEFTQEETFGTVFFSMTGMHAFHVISGVAMLSLLLVQVLRGRYSPQEYWPVTAVVMYWHFVDVVWVFFYPALYLIN